MFNYFFLYKLLFKMVCVNVCKVLSRDSLEGSDMQISKQMPGTIDTVQPSLSSSMQVFFFSFMQYIYNYHKTTICIYFALIKSLPTEYIHVYIVNNMDLQENFYEHACIQTHTQNEILCDQIYIRLVTKCVSIN